MLRYIAPSNLPVELGAWLPRLGKPRSLAPTVRPDLDLTTSTAELPFCVTAVPKVYRQL